MFLLRKYVIRTQLLAKSNGSLRHSSKLSHLIEINPEVRDALAARKPVVALESTIITHGMPHPHNLETALEVEDIVRKEGATPATIAVINGKVKVGLANNELRNLSSLGPESVFKCSRRDLGFVLSKKLCGGTTVAGTLIIANMVGIKVFATGGIGGVHRDGHISMDVSADLVELGRTPVCVVSSGIKSILDIPRTMEYLETQGVCVVSYQNDVRDFPAFYTRSSGVKAPYNVNSPQEAALMLRSSLDLHLDSGILIGVPIPEENAIDEKTINNAIYVAVNTAAKEGIVGKEVTPFVLETVSNITAGKSLESNIALIKNNAFVASQIAVELAKLLNNTDNVSERKLSRSDDEEKVKIENSNVPVVVGASILDVCMTCLEDNLKLNGATYKVKTTKSGGGVGRNIAEGLYKLHGHVHLISAIGDDENGSSLNLPLPSYATATGVVRVSTNATSICTVICDKLGDCKLVLGDMEIHKSITPDLVWQNEKAMAAAPLIVMDANIEVVTMQAILMIAKKYNKPVFFEPTDMRIADKPFNLTRSLTRQIKYISPNIYELQQIAKVFSNVGFPDDIYYSKDDTMKINIARKLAESVIDHFDTIILTLGDLGVLIARNNRESDIQTRYYRARKLTKVVNVSGAGDSFTSGFISAMLAGASEEVCVAVGFKAAQCALMSEGAVPQKYFKDKNEKASWYDTKAIPRNH